MALFKNATEKTVDTPVVKEPNAFSSGALKFLFGFRFVSLIGVFIGSIIYNIQSETNPLDVILTSLNLYLIGLLIVFVVHFILWIFSDKATFYNIKGRVFGFVIDYVFLLLSILSTVGALFLINAFLL